MSVKAWAVVPAGGTGSRFSRHENKLLANLAGVPLLVRTLQALAQAQTIEGIVVAAHPSALEAYQALLTAEETFFKPVCWVEGGDTRRASVYHGLLALPEAVGIVVIHDAARPLIRPQLIDQAVDQVRETNDGVVVAVPIQDTVKRIQPPLSSGVLVVAETVDRRSLWRAQTPQVFPKALIMQAHRQVSQTLEMTDDAQLLEESGLGQVLLLEGDPQNIKITTHSDLKLAELLWDDAVYMSAR